MSTIKGYCDIHPNEYMKDEFQKSIDKAGAIGLHLVHIFTYVEGLSDKLDCRKAYFDSYAEAEVYVYEYNKSHQNRQGLSYLIYINCELYEGRLIGEKAKEFMGLQNKEIKGN